MAIFSVMELTILGLTAAQAEHLEASKELIHQSNPKLHPDVVTFQAVRMCRAMPKKRFTEPKPDPIEEGETSS